MPAQAKPPAPTPAYAHGAVGLCPPSRPSPVTPLTPLGRLLRGAGAQPLRWRLPVPGCRHSPLAAPVPSGSRGPEVGLPEEPFRDLAPLLCLDKVAWCRLAETKTLAAAAAAADFFLLCRYKSSRQRPVLGSSRHSGAERGCPLPPALLWPHSRRQELGPREREAGAAALAGGPSSSPAGAGPHPGGHAPAGQTPGSLRGKPAAAGAQLEPQPCRVGGRWGEWGRAACPCRGQWGDGERCSRAHTSPVTGQPWVGGCMAPSPAMGDSVEGCAQTSPGPQDPHGSHQGLRGRCRHMSSPGWHTEPRTTA